MVFICNFNCSCHLEDIKELYDDYEKTNIDFLFDGFATGHNVWSVSPKAVPEDTIVFMCAKEARHNLGMATSHIPVDYDDDFLDFVKKQKDLYKKYSGNILGYGTVSSIPEKDDLGWAADIKEMTQFVNPVYIDEFRSFITVNQRGSITKLNDEQWERLKWLVDQKNPGLFPDSKSPDLKVLDKEYNEAVQKELNKPIEQLEKLAKKRSSQSVSSTVQTKVYNRDPVIAAYVKKRANGFCQLCGGVAPFNDQKGNPYLECHHVEWLSNGGMDSIDNCVALCPNCHTKMHIVNDADDVKYLKSILL